MLTSEGTGQYSQPSQGKALAHTHNNGKVKVVTRKN